MIRVNWCLAVVMAVVGATSSAAWAACLPESYAYRFEIDASQSFLEIEIEALGLIDSDSSSIIGHAEVMLTPTAGPFVEIHITELVADLTETLSYDLTNALLGGVVADAVDAGIILGIGAATVGPPAAVDALGTFVQVDNAVIVVGDVNYQGTGILGSGLGSGTIALEDFGATPTDIPGTVMVSDGLITLATNLDSAGSFTDPETGLTVDVVVRGDIVATAVVPLGGDIDGDFDVDAADADVFFDGLGGPGVAVQPVPPYTAGELRGFFDCDRDADLDLADWATLQPAATPDANLVG